MAKDFEIGGWVKREKGGTDFNPNRYHLVQSDIGDDAITKCGRRMASTTKTGGALLRYPDSPPKRPGWIDCCIKCNP